MGISNGLLDFLGADPMAGSPQQAAQVPRTAAAPAPPMHKSLAQRILERTMPVPSALNGLLSPDDVRQARAQGLLGLGASLLESSGTVVGGPAPTIGQALGRGILAGHQGFTQAIGSAASLQQMAEQRAVAKARAEQRAGIIAKYPAQPGETPQQVLDRLRRMLPEFINIGDKETVTSIVELLKSAGNDADARPQEVDAGDRVILRDPRTGRETVYKKGTPPGMQAPSRRLETGVNPATNRPEMFEYDPRTGERKWTGITPASSKDGAATEGERKAAVLLALAGDGIKTLDDAEVPSRVTQFAGQRGINEFLTAREQVNRQAGLVVADAYIRLTSGANAPEQEVQRTMQMITPLPGDTPAVLVKKAETRRRLVDALNIAAGRAAATIPTGDRPGGAGAPVTPAAAPAAGAGNASNVRKYLGPR